jgi:hypothetical protein
MGDGPGAAAALSAPELRWSTVTERLLQTAPGSGLARELLHEWNSGWPVDGGAAALRGLTVVDPARLAQMARTCHDTAALSLAGNEARINAALPAALRAR